MTIRKKTVRIKTWDNMVQEYGTDVNGNIKCAAGFVYLMEELLPESRIIEISLTPEDEFYAWEDGKGDSWQISDDMIESVVNIDAECAKKAIEFLEYCLQHPEQRFWQAVRNFTDSNFVYVSEEPVEAEGLKDTFYIK